jgi:chromosome segregation ATPase
VSKEQRIAILEEQLKKSQARQNDQHKLLEQYEGQIDANNTKLEQFKEKERALEASLSDLNEEINREKAFSDARNAELKAMEAIKTELDQLKASYEQLQAELAESQSVVSASTESITEYQNKIVILETENESLTHALASERQAVRQQDASVQHFKAENTRLSANLANADQNFELFACQFLELRQECDRTLQELGASNERCAQMTHMMNTKEDAFQRLQAEFARLRERQGDLEKLKEEQAKNIKRLSEQLEQLQAALDQSHASIQHLREERDQWLSKGEESNTKLTIKVNETIALRQTVSHLEQALENSSATTQSKMRELQKEVDALQLQQKSLIEHISKKEGELAPLQSRLSQAITEICTLKDLNGELKAAKATNLDTIQTLERRFQKEQVGDHMCYILQILRVW